jgi:hypothetical protein
VAYFFYRLRLLWPTATTGVAYKKYSHSPQKSPQKTPFVLFVVVGGAHDNKQNNWLLLKQKTFMWAFSGRSP